MSSSSPDSILHSKAFSRLGESQLAVTDQSRHNLVSSLSSFVDTTVVGGSTPSLQYPSSESLVYGDQEALAEEQLAGSTDSSSESISSSLLHAAEAYLQGLDAQLRLQELLRAVRQLSPPSSCAPSLEILFEQPDHTTSSTSVTGSLSTPALSSLHQPNWLIGNRVDIAIRVEEWRRSVPRERYHPFHHINQVDRRRSYWRRHDLERNGGEYLWPQERCNYKY